MFRYRATMTVKISTRYEFFFFFFSIPCEDSIKIIEIGSCYLFSCPFLVDDVYFYAQRCYVDRIFFTPYDKIFVDEEKDSNSWKLSRYSYMIFEQHFVFDGHVFLGLCVSLVYSMHGVNVFFAYGLLDRVSMLLYDDHYIRRIFNIR